MTDSDTSSLIYSLILLVMIASGLFARRLPIGQMAKYATAWVAIFAAGLLLFSYREEAGRAWHRVVADLNPNAPQSGQGEVRIRRGENGHYNVNASVNGRTVLFMIDSGATTTALSAQSAKAAGVDVDNLGFPVVVDTANGMTEARRATVGRFEIGAIKREEMPVLVSPSFGDTNLLGMNFLDSLDSWRVEGETMVLKP